MGGEMKERSSAIMALVLGVVGFFGAGADVYRPPPISVDGRQVEEGRIEQALLGAPQTALPAQVAVHARDEAVADALVAALPEAQAIAGAHAVQRYLLDGRSRWPAPYTYYPQPEERFDADDVRVEAARAHCDVVAIADRGTRRTGRPNGWVVLSPLLITNLMTPLLRVTEESYLDVWVIDVRTGFLYGQVRAEQRETRGPATIYAFEKPDALDAQLAELVAEVRDKVGDLLWQHLMTAEARPVR
jgi:hypothetical protein